MKKLFLAVAGLALLTGSAFAADMTPPPAPMYKAPPPPPPAVSWTGCYVNGGAGYGVWNIDQNEETDPGLAALTSTTTSGGRGWFGTAGGGCDYQFTLGSFGNFVVGVLGDYDLMDVHGQLVPPPLADVGSEKESSAWAVGGRLGYLVTPNLLTYTNAGFTETRFNSVTFNSSIAPFTPGVNGIPAQTYQGWFLGGGTEYALNWSWLPIRGLFWRNEYRFSTYEGKDVPLFGPGGALLPLAERTNPYTQTIATELVWKFNWQ
jgi:outer membrane immunogenic protein